MFSRYSYLLIWDARWKSKTVPTTSQIFLLEAPKTNGGITFPWRILKIEPQVIPHKQKCIWGSRFFFKKNVNFVFRLLLEYLLKVFKQFIIEKDVPLFIWLLYFQNYKAHRVQGQNKLKLLVISKYLVSFKKYLLWLCAGHSLGTVLYLKSFWNKHLLLKCLFKNKHSKSPIA